MSTAPDAALSLIPLLFGCVFFVIGVLGTIFWIWMLVEAVTREPEQGNDRIVWMLIILLTHFIGALIYYFVRRPERIRTLGR